jgi:hypothetical protein
MVGNGGSTTSRPQPFSLGLGFGTVISGNFLAEPSAVSARFVLTDKIELQPSLLAQVGDEDTDTPFGVGGTLRYLLVGRGPVDLHALGALVFASDNTSSGNINPVEVTTNSFGLGWGAGLTWSLTAQWAVSLDASNPLFTLTSVKADGVEGQTRWKGGVVWNPQLLLLVNLFL